MKVIPIILVLILSICAQFVYFQYAEFCPLHSPSIQNEITSPNILLNDKGHIINEGWARKPYWKYERSKVKDITRIRIKEWDYYATISHHHKFGIAATISDLSYGSLLALTYIDLENGTTTQIDAMEFFTFGKMNLSSSSNVDNVVEWSNSNFSLRFERRGSIRYLTLSAPKMKISEDRIGLFANLTLFQSPLMESMNIATSWAKDRTSFYLNEKVNCMKTKGIIKVGKTEFKLKMADALSVLDWGRGKWTYQNRWYWSSLSAYVNGELFGFNLGYGFSDRSSATENVIFYKEKAHKIDQVVFNIPQKNGEIIYTDPWTITSNDGRLSLDFVPIVDRSSKVDFVAIKSIQHQVFGNFSGNVTLDNGKVVVVKDIYGFAEDVFNRW
ncbi:hypothetical protein TRFO_22872 [Tritrichomonas foetus]|uniref:DUF2804 domain-containing protein n=1 Tax=Tritrichomonas foetus TaxID=1144522 RepID=A0A1J4KAU8_9EUKA|nr:hypothetical protein TRFO_22872 [Tritrichomonas foetus]|eukprot:OHT08537.1 hypothetical protein TRFO_22872 [Tritrichomonas foetus]